MRRLPWPLLLAYEEDELLRDLLFGKKKDLEEGRAYLVKEKKPERALAAFQRAVDAGCKVLMPPTDMFWGDRFGKLEDPFGNQWAMATHKEDVPPAEIKRRGEAAMAQMARPS